jgi:hypothetical protein
MRIKERMPAPEEEAEGRTGTPHLGCGDRRQPGRALVPHRPDHAPRLINGAAGIIAFLHGRPFSIATLTVKNGKIAEINFLAHPDRIAHLDLTELGD